MRKKFQVLLARFNNEKKVKCDAKKIKGKEWKFSGESVSLDRQVNRSCCYFSTSRVEWAMSVERAEKECPLPSLFLCH